jgi:hypothetical protein
VKPYPVFTTGEYTDTHGGIWFCVRQEKEQRMICDSDDGHYTVAGFSTFKVWNWKKN